MADNIYLDLSITTDTNVESSPARITVAYDQPILNKPSDYYLSVIKFEIPLQELPLFVFPDSSLPIEDQFVVGIVENSADEPLVPLTPAFQTTVQYISSGANDDENYVYSYERMAQMLSAALSTSWIAAGGPGGANGKPYIVFLQEESKFGLIMTSDFVNAANVLLPPGRGWTICWNNTLQSIISSFNVYEQNDPAFKFGRYDLSTFQIDNGDLTFLAPPPYVQPPVNAYFTYLVKQEYATLDYLNSVRKIILVSNTMPVRKEHYPPPTPPGQVINFGIPNTVPIINDFQLDLNNVAGSQRGVALYEASPYQLIDLISDTPMSRVDVSLMWSDQFNVLRPLFIRRSDSATIKLAFLLRETYMG